MTLMYRVLLLVLATLLLPGAASKAASKAPRSCNGRDVVLIDARTGRVKRGFPDRAITSVLSSVADGRGGWYVGGSFQGGSVEGIAHVTRRGPLTRLFTTSRGGIPSLAREGAVVYAGSDAGVIAIDGGSGKVLWRARLQSTSPGPVQQVTLANRVLYVVGSFTRIGGVRRPSIAALDPKTGRVLRWSSTSRNGPEVGDLLSVAGSRNAVYVGGQFDRLGGGVRLNLGAVSPRTGRATSWVASPRARRVAADVEQILVTHGQVIAGGHDGFSANRTTDGRKLAWTMRLGGTATRFAVSGDVLYLGGNLRDGFTAIGGKPANDLAAVELPGGHVTAWRPRVARDVIVTTLAVSGRTVLAGGFFGPTIAC